MAYNSCGSYRTTREKMMKAFDKLPPECREALANAIGNYVPQPYLTMLRRGESADDVIRSIEFSGMIETNKTITALKNGTYAKPPRVRRFRVPSLGCYRIRKYS